MVSKYVLITKLIILKEENQERLDVLRPNRDLLQKMQLMAIQLGIEPASSRVNTTMFCLDYDFPSFPSWIINEFNDWS